MSEKRLFKEYNQYLKSPPHDTYPQILELCPVDDEHIHKWRATIAKPTKNDSPYYYNGKWELAIDVGNDYPIKPPKITFVSTINHPNINIDTGEICLDILKSDAWSPAWNLQHLVAAILMLIDDPEPDSPLNVDSANLFRHDLCAFELLVQYTMWREGTLIEGARSDGDREESQSESEQCDEESEEGEGNESEENQEKENVNDEKEINKETKERLKEENEKQIYESQKNEKQMNEGQENENQMNEGQGEQENYVETSINLEKPNFETPKTPVNETISPQEANFKVIHDVGEEVTKQFIAKVDEISHEFDSSGTLLPVDLSGFNPVREQVAKTVTKQVEDLFSRCEGACPAPVEERKDERVERIRQQFIQLVEAKVNEHLERA